jgi:hypothetical protein
MQAALLAGALAVQILVLVAVFLLRRTRRNPNGLHPAVAWPLILSYAVAAAWYVMDWRLLSGANGPTAGLVALWLPALRSALLFFAALAALSIYWRAPWRKRVGL